MITVQLSEEQWDYLLEILEFTTDSGPHSAGWKSRELSSLVANIEHQVEEGREKH